MKDAWTEPLGQPFQPFLLPGLRLFRQEAVFRSRDALSFVADMAMQADGVNPR